MKKFIENNILNFTYIVLAVLSLNVIVSCGSDDGVNSTSELDAVKAALDGSWGVDSSNSSYAGSGTLDPSSWTIAFTTSGTGASFTLGGDITDYITGGSFSISEEGVISAETATFPSSSGLTGNLSVSMNSDLTVVTLDITTSAARTEGIGTYSLVFSVQ